MTRWPVINDRIYSVTTFASAMIVLYIAMAIGRDRPYRVMATVTIEPGTAPNGRAR